MNAPDDGREGFALLETVIAFTILAIALGIGVETISRNAKTFLRASDLETATLVLDALAAGELKHLERTGITTGTIEDAEWRMAATAVADDHARPLAAVTITILPRGETGPQFTYHTFADLAGTQ